MGEEERGEGEDRPRHQEDHFDGPPCLGWIIIQERFALVSAKDLSVPELRLQDDPDLWHR